MRSSGKKKGKPEAEKEEEGMEKNKIAVGG